MGAFEAFTSPPLLSAPGPLRLNRENPIANKFLYMFAPGISPASVAMDAGYAPIGDRSALTFGKVAKFTGTNVAQAIITGQSTYPFVMIWAGRFLSSANNWIGVSVSRNGGSGDSQALALSSSTQVHYSTRNNFTPAGAPDILNLTIPGGVVGVDLVIVGQSLSATDHRIYCAGLSAASTVNSGTPAGAFNRLNLSVNGTANHQTYFAGFGTPKDGLSDEVALLLSRNVEMTARMLLAPMKRRVWAAGFAAAGTPYGLSNEADAAYALAGALAGLPGLATEPDIAYSETGSLRGVLGLSNEADTAYAQAGAAKGAAGLANEADLAYAETGSLRGTYGLSTELDLAYALLSSGGYGLATEADVSYALTGSLRGAVGLSTEADTAYALSLTYGNTYGLASEADIAINIAGALRGANGMATEADQAYALTFFVGKSYGLAVEPDLAYALAGKLVGQLSLATELDVAYALTQSGVVFEPTNGYTTKLVRGTWTAKASAAGRKAKYQ